MSKESKMVGMLRELDDLKDAMALTAFCWEIANIKGPTLRGDTAKEQLEIFGDALAKLLEFCVNQKAVNHE